MRLMAERRSPIGLPEVFKDAEFAMRMSRAASAGSEPITRATFSRLALGSDKTRRTRMTTSGNEGRSILPVESSAANALTNANVAWLEDCAFGVVI